VPEWFGKPVKGCGSGEARVRGSLDLAKETANDRARTSLSKNLMVEIQGLLKSYQASGESDAKGFYEESTDNTIRTLVDRELSGSFPVEGKMATISIDGQPQSNFYAMVCMDPQFYGKMFDEMKNLSQKDRAALKARADAAHDELKAAVAAKRARENGGQ
jgi:hypothetical protein